MRLCAYAQPCAKTVLPGQVCSFLLVGSAQVATMLEHVAAHTLTRCVEVMQAPSSYDRNASTCNTCCMLQVMRDGCSVHVSLLVPPSLPGQVRSWGHHQQACFACRHITTTALVLATHACLCM